MRHLKSLKSAWFIIVFAVSAVMMSLLLSGCGGGNSSNKATPQPNQPSNPNNPVIPASIESAEFSTTIIAYNEPTTITVKVVVANAGTSEVKLVGTDGAEFVGVQLLRSEINTAGYKVYTFEWDVLPTTREQFFVQALVSSEQGSAPMKTEPERIIVIDVYPPADPGEAGKATLAGIDADNNGVRDDIQIYVGEKHPASRAARAALQQAAIVYQSALENAADILSSGEVKIAAIASKQLKAADCMSYVFGNDAGEENAALISRVLNTPDRNAASTEFNRFFGGLMLRQISEQERKAACSFDINRMLNLK